MLLEAIRNEDLSIADAIRCLHNSNNRKIDILKSMDFTIDYNLFSLMIATVNYRKNLEINEENFPLPLELVGKKLRVSTKLFHFNWKISSRDVISEMTNVGFYPSILAESLFITSKPRFTMGYRIVTLGSVLQTPDGNRLVPCQFVNGRHRLYLYWLDSTWATDYSFLGIKFIED